jgi:hypothetical protein
MPTPRRCWIAFRLRTIFLAVVVLSFPLAWVGYSLNWIRARNAVLRNGGFSHLKLASGTPAAPAGLWVLGKKAYAQMDIDRNEKRAPTVEDAQRLFPEASITEYDKDGRQRQ